MAKSKTGDRKPRGRDVSAEAILDEALRIAEDKGWGRTSLADVARSLGVSLAVVRAFQPAMTDVLVRKY